MFIREKKKIAHVHEGNATKMPYPASLSKMRKKVSCTKKIIKDAEFMLKCSELAYNLNKKKIFSNSQNSKKLLLTILV